MLSELEKQAAAPSAPPAIWAANEPHDNESELELTEYWFKELRSGRRPSPRQEPQLDERSVDFVKLACDSLKQDEHVFVTAVDTIEAYGRQKELQGQEEASDPLLTIGAVVLLCSKAVGSQVELKVRFVENFLRKVSGREHLSRLIKLQEIDVMKTLRGNIPCVTMVDDLNVFFGWYVAPMKLREDLRPLCLEILQTVYIVRRDFYGGLKQFYTKNAETELVFRQIYGNRLYLPAGIVLCAFAKTKLFDVLDSKKVLRELNDSLGIHSDHLLYLCNAILGFVDQAV